MGEPGRKSVRARVRRYRRNAAVHSGFPVDAMRHLGRGRLRSGRLLDGVQTEELLGNEFNLRPGSGDSDTVLYITVLSHCVTVSVSHCVTLCHTVCHIVLHCVTHTHPLNTATSTYTETSKQSSLLKLSV